MQNFKADCRKGVDLGLKSITLEYCCRSVSLDQLVPRRFIYRIFGIAPADVNIISWNKTTWARSYLVVLAREKGLRRR